MKSLYLSETGYDISYPRELASKHDLAGVDLLKVIVAGQIPQHDLPKAIRQLLTKSPIPLQDLIIHFTGTANPAQSYSHAKLFFDSMCDAVNDTLTHPPRFSVSWNLQKKKRDVRQTQMLRPMRRHLGRSSVL